MVQWKVGHCVTSSFLSIFRVGLPLNQGKRGRLNEISTINVYENPIISTIHGAKTTTFTSTNWFVWNRHHPNKRRMFPGGTSISNPSACLCGHHLHLLEHKWCLHQLPRLYPHVSRHQSYSSPAENCFFAAEDWWKNDEWTWKPSNPTKFPMTITGYFFVSCFSVGGCLYRSGCCNCIPVFLFST